MTGLLPGPKDSRRKHQSAFREKARSDKFPAIRSPIVKYAPTFLRSEFDKSFGFFQLPGPSRAEECKRDPFHDWSVSGESRTIPRAYARGAKWPYIL
jgi:hypothetical protein